jgi:hypothetical protein
MNFTTLRNSNLNSEDADVLHQVVSYCGYTLKLVGTPSMHEGEEKCMQNSEPNISRDFSIIGRTVNMNFKSRM